MTVHFLHTSDWHLGQLFYNYSRQYEHEQFLAWLLKQIEQKQPHALLIAGDIFDVINPSSQAQKQLYQFLADAHDLAPNMQTLMIAGNHDSGYRIEQVEPLLAKFNAKAVGIIHWNADKTLNTKRLILPIYDQSKKIVAWCVALPFLRPAEITGFNEQSHDHQSAIEYVHQSLIAEAQRRKTPEQALIVMSHAHMQGGEESDSERRIVIGNQEALSTDLFTDAIDYVALGHLHKPQKVQHAHIRYSGSPIPLSFSEINYQHQVLEVWIDPTLDEQRFRYDVLPIPRSVQLHRISDELEQVMQQLKHLPQGEIANLEQREYVDVEYHSTTPPPLDLRQQIEQALPQNRYRLLRICRKHISQHADDPQQSKIDLAPPTPQQLFCTLWDKMGFDHNEEVQQDFLTLLHDAEQLQQQQKTGL